MVKRRVKNLSRTLPRCIDMTGTPSPQPQIKDHLEVGPVSQDDEISMQTTAEERYVTVVTPPTC